jgi:dihydroorotate dehydrogenase (fumarate)
LPDLSVNYLGLALKNPLLAAPAGATETLARMKRAEEAGVGGVVVKTLFEQELARRSPSPRFRVLRPELGRSESFVLYSYEQASAFGPQEYAAEISRAKEGLSVPVIASIACVTEEKWAEYARLMEQAGADALELNLSCPHGAKMLSRADPCAELERLLPEIRRTCRLPLVPKLPGQLTDPVAAALRLEAAGADGLVMFNRFTGLDIDLESERPLLHGSYAGHGGPWALYYVLRWVSAAAPRLRIPISASGGVASGADAAKLLLAGATTVQVCTAMLVEGYGVIRRMLRELEDFMSAKGYARLSEFRGKACGRILAAEQVDRVSRVRGEIDRRRCDRCGLCLRVCFYGAIETEGAEYRVTRACEGCGLCAELCLPGAIGLVRI